MAFSIHVKWRTVCPAEALRPGHPTHRPTGPADGKTLYANMGKIGEFTTEIWEQYANMEEYALFLETSGIFFWGLFSNITILWQYGNFMGIIWNKNNTK